MMTNAVATIIHATSPLLATGVGAADAAEAGASALDAAADAGAAAIDAAASGAEAACAKTAPVKPMTDRPRARVAMSFFMWFLFCASKGVLARFAGANADYLLKRRDKNFAVADLSGASGAFNGFDHTVDQRIVNRRLDLHFGQEVNDVLRTAVQLGVAFLSTEAFDFGHCDSLHADGAEGLTNFVKLERLDDGSHHLHGHLLLRV